MMIISDSNDKFDNAALALVKKWKAEGKLSDKFTFEDTRELANVMRQEADKAVAG